MNYKKRERRQVSFNTEDQVERELLQFVDQKEINFSRLMKHLLFTYMMGKMEPASPSATRSLSSVKSQPSPPPSSIKSSGIPFDF